jgi:hypothetical protein
MPDGRESVEGRLESLRDIRDSSHEDKKFTHDFEEKLGIQMAFSKSF